MSGEHTAGQRTVAHAGFERKVCVVARRAGRPVTVAMFDSGNKDEDEANARLDAAAPELLEALIAYHKHFGPLEDNIMLHEDCRNCAKLARSALRKASGEG